ncbi:MAG: ATP-binding protein, partial [Aquificaceae bacterium]
ICSLAQIRNYQSKLSGPILDRMDLKVWIEPTEKEELLERSKGETSTQMKERIERAVKVQRQRFKERGFFFNSRMGEKDVEEFCILDDRAKELLKKAIDRLNLTGRSYMKLLKVSRTIADLEGEELIRHHHISEALQFRIDERLLL